MSAIHKLDPTTVNRIAAGEVVQRYGGTLVRAMASVYCSDRRTCMRRPAAAVKELIENSIDAGSKQITVTVKNGGLDLMQIQDDGCGIRKDDMGIVCERFTTSKLSKFEDLKSISTFGFRGEALASITHVARVTITTKTATSPCAYKGKYSDGKLVPLKHGESMDPKPCAGVNGTTITVEDLFYNMKARRTAFKNTSEQYQRILDVVTRYAIHYGDSHIAFTCRKQGQSIPDIHTPSNPSSTLENIRIAFGSALTRELLKCEFSFEFDQSEGPVESVSESGTALTCSVKGYVSNANYSMKRSTFIFFINHRLVDCSSIKKMLESFYSELLPKTGHPFVYLSIEIPPQIVDVNIHPTKKEVCFLFESQLLHQIYSQARMLLSSANESRTFTTQSVLPGRNSLEEICAERESASNGVSNTPSADRQMGGERGDRGGRNAGGRESDSRSADSPSMVSPVGEESGDDASQQISDSGRKRKRVISEEKDPSPPRAAPRELSDSAYFDMHIESEEDETVELAPQPNKRSGLVSHISTSDSTSRRESTRSTGANRGSGTSNGSSRPYVRTAAPNKLVRTDPRMARIDQFFPNAPIGSKTDESNLEVSGGSGAQRPVALDTADEESVDNSSSEPRAAKPFRKNKGVLLCMPVGSCTCCLPSNSGLVRPPPTGELQGNGSDEDTESTAVHPVPAAPSAVMPRLQPVVDTSCQYLSVIDLIADIRANYHSGVDAMLKKLTYVGVVNSVYMLGQVCNFCVISAVTGIYGYFYLFSLRSQVDTKLLLIDFSLLSRQLFYQLAVRRFGEHRPMSLPQPVRIADYVTAALHLKENQWSEGDGSMADICSAVRSFLSEKRGLLLDYFSIEISEDGALLRGLPALLSGHTPCPLHLPTFLLRLATAVDWDDEKSCFQDIAMELSILYSRFELQCDVDSPEVAAAERSCGLALSTAANATLQNLFVPAFKQLLIPPRSVISDSATTIVEVTRLEKLYKVFERC